MSDKRKNEGTAGRRDFLKLVGITGAAVSSLPLSETVSAAMPAAHKAHNSVAACGPRTISAGYEFFNTDESAFIESAVDTLIPKDSVGPGAAELGVATYIDRQMAGGYGKGSVVSGRSVWRGNTTAGISIADDSFRANPNRHRGRQ